jgi:hypothetical protein
MAVTIRIRRGNTSQWNARSTPLLVGELGWDTQLKELKIGNGTSLWSSLVPINLPENNTFADISDIVTSYNDLTDLPNLFDGDYDSLSNLPTLFSGSYEDLSNKPTIPSLNGYATETYVSTALSGLVDSAPETLNTLNELASALGNDANFATTITTSIGLKAPIDSPTFTGTVSGITSTMVGLGNVDNTSDINKPVSTATQTELNLKAPIANPTFTGTVSGVTKTHVGLGNVDNTSDLNKPISTATQSALDDKVSNNLPAIDYYITNDGSGSYIVNGVSNGYISFEKGKRYRLYINASGHPFWIQTVSGAYSESNIYNTGITNNGTALGSIIVELPQNAPTGLFYACQFHSSMNGAISIKSTQVGTTINQQSSNYTISILDSDKLIEMSGGGTLTISDSSSFPVGFTVNILQTGSSQVTIAGSGFTPNATPGLKLRAQWSSATLIKRALNSWVVMGDLSA